MQRHQSTTLGAIAMLLLAASVHVTGQTLDFIRPTYRYLVGEQARLVCTVQSGFNIHTPWVWTNDSETVIQDDRISVTTSSTASILTINNLRLEDAGQYSCSREGFPTVTATLTVIAPDTPDFLDVEEHQVFAEGTDAVVRCPANFGSSSQTRMYWFHANNNSIIQTDDRFTAENEQLRIRDIGMEYSRARYRCSIIRPNPYLILDKFIEVEVRPQSEYVPKISNLRRRVTVSADQPLNLPCQLEEPRDNVNYSWTIHTEFEHDHLVNSEATLHRDRGQFLGGIYTCRAENQFGYDIADFAIKITAAPMPSECTVVKKATIGSTVVLKYCDLTTPVQLSELAFQWNKSAVHIQLGERFTVNHHGWLTIKNVQESDFGIYKVNISNDIDNAVHSVKLEEAVPTTEPTIASNSARLSQVVAINFKFHIQGSGSTSCNDIKEKDKDFFQEKLLQQFTFAPSANIHFENPKISCSSASKFEGTFKSNLRGTVATQLVAQIRAKGVTPFALNNGQTVTIKICTNECSLEDSTAPKPWINKTSGVVIAVTVIAVMLAGVILLMVILIRYRRRSQIKDFNDEEQVLPLHMAPLSSVGKNFMAKKPSYSRSISVNLPITSR